jgi:hypothetical protein
MKMRRLSILIILAALVSGLVAACATGPAQPVPKVCNIDKADGTTEKVTFVFWCYDDPYGLTMKGVSCFDSQGKLIANNAASGAGPVQSTVQTLAGSAANATFVGAMMGLLTPASSNTAVTVKSSGTK